MEQQSVFTSQLQRCRFGRRGEGLDAVSPVIPLGQPSWRRGGQMAAVLRVSQLCACLLSGAIDVGLGEMQQAFTRP